MKLKNITKITMNEQEYKDFETAYKVICNLRDALEEKNLIIPTNKLQDVVEILADIMNCEYGFLLEIK